MSNSYLKKQLVSLILASLLGGASFALALVAGVVKALPHPLFFIAITLCALGIITANLINIFGKE